MVFSRKSPSALPAKRLWKYLVNEEQSQGIFIKYIFKRKAPTPVTPLPINKVNRLGYLEKEREEPFHLFQVCTSFKNTTFKTFTFITTD